MAGSPVAADTAAGDSRHPPTHPRPPRPDTSPSTPRPSPPPPHPPLAPAVVAEPPPPAPRRARRGPQVGQPGPVRVGAEVVDLARGDEPRQERILARLHRVGREGDRKMLAVDRQ